MGWMVWGWNPGEGEIFRIRPDWSGPIQPPVQWVLGLFLGAKERVELYFYSHIWTFMACSTVNFTFTLQCRLQCMSEVHKFSKNLEAQFKILGAIRVTRSKLNIEDPKILGATIYLVAWVT